VARLGIIEVLGRPNGPYILAAHSKERKEIVQYHPPRGRPCGTMVIVRKVKK